MLKITSKLQRGVYAPNKTSCSSYEHLAVIVNPSAKTPALYSTCESDVTSSDLKRKTRDRLYRQNTRNIITSHERSLTLAAKQFIVINEPPQRWFDHQFPITPRWLPAGALNTLPAYRAQNLDQEIYTASHRLGRWSTHHWLQLISRQSQIPEFFHKIHCHTCCSRASCASLPQ
jgi:hypothetical protein